MRGEERAGPTLSGTDTNGTFRDGVADSVPIVVAAAPLGLLFGALVAQAGLGPLDAMVMSATVYAGASQMVAVDLFGNGVPAWAIVLSVLAVNFRHVLYSAAVAPAFSLFPPGRRAVAFFLLIDPQFALAERRREAGYSVSFSWYLGLACPIYVLWIAEAGLGASFGATIDDPRALGLDMILPVYFLALVMGFRSRRNWAAVVATSGTVAVVAFLTVGSPWHVSLGALAGVAVAAILPPPRALPRPGTK